MAFPTIIVREPVVSARACADRAECLTGASLAAHAELFPFDTLQGERTPTACGVQMPMPANVVDRIVVERRVDGDAGEVVRRCSPSDKTIDQRLSWRLPGRTGRRPNDCWRARAVLAPWRRCVRRRALEPPCGPGNQVRRRATHPSVTTSPDGEPSCHLFRYHCSKAAQMRKKRPSHRELR